MASNESYPHVGDNTPSKNASLADLKPERIMVTPDQWDAFMELLDAPARPMPKLVELFRRPSPFTEDQ